MSKQREKISYARLVSRTDFYKKKALDLEQQVVFAEENAKAVKHELKQLRNNSARNLKELQTKFNGLEKEREQLREVHERVQKEYGQLQADYRRFESEKSQEGTEELTKQLEEKEKTINDLNETIVELNQRKKGSGEERIKEFERLLADVQKDLNGKEEQLNSYRNRVTTLEKRLSNEQSVPVRKVFSENEEGQKTDKKVLAYFDYSIVINTEKESIIRGNFHIENIGGKPLGTPFVCFRFYPIDASTLKGKIISIEKAQQGEESRLPRWVYMDGEWGQTAKERGEIWVRPYGEIALKTSEKLTLPDFQIPVRQHFDEKVIVEGFVYFQKSQYKEKSSNQILITF